jgi:hypothetical protein
VKTFQTQNGIVRSGTSANVDASDGARRFRTYVAASVAAMDFVVGEDVCTSRPSSARASATTRSNAAVVADAGAGAGAMTGGRSLGVRARVGVD